MNTVLSSHIARVVLAATIGFATLFGALAAASPTSTNIRAQTIPLSRLLGSESSMARGATSEYTVARRAGGCTNSPDSGGWLTTSGAWVVDAGNNCKVRLEGVNWYGMQTQYYVPAGLDLASFQDVLAEIKSLGFNSV